MGFIVLRKDDTGDFCNSCQQRGAQPLFTVNQFVVRDPLLSPLLFDRKWLDDAVFFDGLGKTDDGIGALAAFVRPFALNLLGAKEKKESGF